MAQQSNENSKVETNLSVKEAYDLNHLIALLKDEGLDVTEDLAKVLVQAVFDWIKFSAKKSDTRIDDLIASLIPNIEPWIMERIDKIDGEKG